MGGRGGDEGLRPAVNAAMQPAAAFDLPVARETIRDALAPPVPRQRRNGTFGTPCAVERVSGVVVAAKALA